MREAVSPRVGFFRYFLSAVAYVEVAYLFKKILHGHGKSAACLYWLFMWRVNRLILDRHWVHGFQSLFHRRSLCSRLLR